MSGLAALDPPMLHLDVSIGNTIVVEGNNADADVLLTDLGTACKAPGNCRERCGASQGQRCLWHALLQTCERWLSSYVLCYVSLMMALLTKLIDFKLPLPGSHLDASNSPTLLHVHATWS